MLTTNLNGDVVKVQERVEFSLEDKASSAGHARAAFGRAMVERPKLAKVLGVRSSLITDAVWASYQAGYHFWS